MEPYITHPKGGLMEQGYQVEGVHDRDLISFRHRSKVCGRGGIGGGGGGGGGRVEPYITPPKGGLMEQGYQVSVVHSIDLIPLFH